MTNRKPLHIPHGSRHVPEAEWTDEPRMIPKVWHAIAAEKGYRVDRRVRDRFHVVLECLDCGAHTVHKVSNLRSAQPACGGCQEAAMRANALRAGVILGERDENHRHMPATRCPAGTWRGCSAAASPSWRRKARHRDVVGIIATFVTTISCRNRPRNSAGP